MEHAAAHFACGRQGPDGQAEHRNIQMQNRKQKDTQISLRFSKTIRRK
jgi:hypothetical protein